MNSSNSVRPARSASGPTVQQVQQVQPRSLEGQRCVRAHLSHPNGHQETRSSKRCRCSPPWHITSEQLLLHGFHDTFSNLGLRPNRWEWSLHRRSSQRAGWTEPRSPFPWRNDGWSRSEGFQSDLPVDLRRCTWGGYHKVSNKRAQKSLLMRRWPHRNMGHHNKKYDTPQSRFYWVGSKMGDDRMTFKH